MRPCGKPDLKTGSQVEPFDGMLILPDVSKHPSQQDEEHRHYPNEGMGVDERQVCRLVDADDLRGCRAHYPVSEPLPAPFVIVQGVNGTAPQDIDAPTREGTQPQKGIQPARATSPLKAGLQYSALPQRQMLKWILVERWTYRSPALRAVASGLWPLFLASLPKDVAPGGMDSRNRPNSLPLPPTCQVTC